MDHRILQTMLTQPTDGTNYSRKEESALVPVSLCSGESSTKRTEDMDAQSSLTQEDVKSKVFFLRQGNSVKLQRQVIRNLKENNHHHCNEFLTCFINWGLFTQKEMCLDPQLLFWCLYCMRTNHAYSLSHSPEALLCARKNSDWLWTNFPGDLLSSYSLKPSIYAQKCTTWSDEDTPCCSVKRPDPCPTTQWVMGVTKVHTNTQREICGHTCTHKHAGVEDMSVQKKGFYTTFCKQKCSL